MGNASAWIGRIQSQTHHDGEAVMKAVIEMQRHHLNNIDTKIDREFEQEIHEE